MSFPVDEHLILVAEKQLGRRLPEALRGRLRQENGGEVETDGDTWRLFPVWDASDRRRIARTANHIVRETEQAREWWGFPVGAIAVAENGSGDLLILQPGSDEILHWEHETAECEPVTLDLA